MRFCTYGFIGVLVIAGSGFGVVEGVELQMLCQEGDVIDGTRVRTITYFGSLNNVDDVAFCGLCGTSGVITGVFTQDRLVVTEGDISDGRTIADIFGAAAMNDSGQVAFHAKIESDTYLRGIFVDTDLVFMDGDTVDGTPTWASKPLELRADGTVLRVNDSKVIVGNHAVLKQGDVIDGQVFCGFGNYVEADINSVGEVAFCGYFEEYVDPPAIATLDRIVAAVGDVMDGKVLTGAVRAHINDTGNVSYLGYYDGIRGIFTENRLVVAVGDAIDGRILTTIPYDFEVNNAGEIAFIAYFENGSGIFTQDRLIAQIGDVVDGKIISNFSSLHINDRGHVAFLATFDDGTRGVVLAVPEPCMMMQLIFGGLVLGMIAVVRRNCQIRFGKH